MKEMIAYCGLDCEKCEARIATLNNDDSLREKVAKEWSAMNNCEIKAEMINCTGCKSDGIKSYFCSELCEIRQCAVKKKYENCGQCSGLTGCEKIKMIIDHNDEALKNLKS